MTHLLRCLACGQIFPDTYLLSCPNGCNSLLRAEYSAKHITIHPIPGIFKYKDWLPVHDTLTTKAEPVCYKSSHLARVMGLSRLWIVFSGYWPEKSALVLSGSFKEFEAFPTVQRMKECVSGVIQVASAGNTGRAFAEVSAQTGQPVIIVIPQSAHDRIWTTRPAPHVLLITISGDYTDAINLGNKICSIPGICPEGGAKNVARRDGMGTVMLAGTVNIGHLPDLYVQAVGSGTGGIAAYEASLRLIEDGRFGTKMPRLLLFQNEPFIPLVRAWQEKRQDVRDEDMPDAKRAIAQVFSDVLTNRTPPYGIAGGLFDALVATDGIMGGVTTSEAEEAGKIFLSQEGIDLDPAAAVCVAGLLKSVQSGIINPDETVLLNITGGGYESGKRDLSRYEKEPDIIATKDTPFEIISLKIKEWIILYV